MPTSTGRPPNQANPTLLHPFLGIGLIVLGAAAVIARYSGLIGDPQGDPRLAAYTLAGVSFLMCAAAVLLLKPLVRRREASQTREAYWSNASTAAKALRVWFILEGAGVMASVSYFLGGGAIAATLIVLAVVAFWLNGPRAFDRG